MKKWLGRLKVEVGFLAVLSILVLVSYQNCGGMRSQKSQSLSTGISSVSGLSKNKVQYGDMILDLADQNLSNPRRQFQMGKERVSSFATAFQFYNSKTWPGGVMPVRFFGATQAQINQFSAACAAWERAAYCAFDLSKKCMTPLPQYSEFENRFGVFNEISALDAQGMRDLYQLRADPTAVSTAQKDLIIQSAGGPGVSLISYQWAHLFGEVVGKNPPNPQSYGLDASSASVRYFKGDEWFNLLVERNVVVIREDTGTSARDLAIAKKNEA